VLLERVCCLHVQNDCWMDGCLTRLRGNCARLPPLAAVIPACQVVGHGFPAGHMERLALSAKQFFALPVAEKRRMRMERAGHR